MRIASFFAVATAVMWLGSHAPASAAQIPPGSYRQSCTNITSNGSLISATCPDVNGNMHSASLNYARCPGSQVANNNGVLVCGAGGYNIGRTLPGGSWRASCKNASKTNTTLFATCDNGYGGWTNSSLNLAGCPTRLVGNNHGSLFCSGDANGAYLPPGAWRNSCRDAREDGRMIYADCDDGRGNYRPTQVDTGVCPRSEIINTAGRLYCINHPGRGNGDADDNHNGNGNHYGNGDGNGNRYTTLPAGTWRTTCRNGSITGTILHAQCLNSGGSWVGTSFDLRRCSGPLGNSNGQLVCQGRRNDGDGDSN